MSAQQSAQPIAATLEDGSGPLDVLDRRLDLALYPDLLTDAEFRTVMRLSPWFFYQLLRADKLRPFLHEPRLGPRQWRKAQVARYRAGEMAPVRVFGRRTA